MKKYIQSLLIGLASLSVLPLYPQLSAHKAELLAKHLAVVKELKTVFAEPNSDIVSRGKRHKTASDAHQNIPTFRNIIDKEWGDFWVNHADLVENILERERSLAHDYFVFYHAQRSDFRIIQDFLREIFEYIHIHSELTSFEFLRLWNDMPSAVDANTFIDENNKKYGYWTDHIDEVAQHILSVNLSLFGNCKNIDVWECTFDYFLASRSVKFVSILFLLKHIFTCFGFNEEYIDSFFELNKSIKVSEGCLFQICIPKHLVDRCAYISYCLGVPMKEAFPGCSFDEGKMRHTEIAPLLERYRLGSLYIDEIAHTTCVSEKDAESKYDALQARLVFSQDILLNPESGVKIYRYTTIPEHTMVQYKTQLKQLVQSVISEWLSGNHFTEAIEGTQLETLCQQIEASL